MVNLVCDQVTIGSDEEEGDVTVDERYLASEIIEYWGESFVAGGGDYPFPYYEDFSSVGSGKPVINIFAQKRRLFSGKGQLFSAYFFLYSTGLIPVMRLNSEEK